MKLKINKKKILSLLVLGNMVLSHVPHASADMYVEGDNIRANTKVNIRVDNSLDADRIGSINEGAEARRILSCDNGWDLISYNGRIGFVKSEYFTDISDENIYCDITFTEMRKILMSTDNVNMRMNPFIEADKILTIKKNSYVEVLAYVSNDWYLVNYNGQLGFVSGAYLDDIDYNNEEVKEEKTIVRAIKEVNIRRGPSTSSERLNILYENDIIDYVGTYDNEWYIVNYYGEEAYINRNYVALEEYTPVDFMKVVEINKNTNLFSYASENADTIGCLDEYETAEVLSDEGEFLLVKTLEQEGYIRKSDTKNLTGLIVAIDISEQKLIIYQDNKVLLKANVVTGKDKTPTPMGEFKVQYKAENYTLTGPCYVCPVSYWIQFNGNYGIHDYEMNGKFGGSIFHKNGSHGCVRMHVVTAKNVYHLVKRGTPVIIHK